MAFVPGFEHDVFISYAHADNDPLVKGDDGYVTKFYENLTQFLTAELGRREYFSIWRDSDELRGNDDFDARINMAFLKSAILVSISSQSYVESAWCRRELISFSGHRHTDFELQVGEQSTYRVFRVERLPVRELHPDIPPYFFGSMLGYKFYEAEEGIDQPFRRTKPDDDDQRYWNAMRRIARDIAQLLRQMKKMAQPVPVLWSGKTVFLADVADDLEDQRSGVKSALEQHNQVKAALAGQGLRVIPEFPVSLGDPGLINSLREAIRSADMAVHLIGQLPGKAPMGETRRLVQLQWELAGEVAREKSLQRVAWLAEGVEIDKLREDHRAFLRSLEDSIDGSQTEILRVGIEELRETLLRRLFPPPVSNNGSDEKQEEIDRLIYLTYLPADRDGAVQIKEALRRERLDVKLFRYEDRDPQMLARIHNASLEKSDGVMIFYGTDTLWLDKLVDEARDTLRARAKKNPLKAVCICNGPPEQKSSPIDVDYDKFIIADCYNGIRPEDLQRFLSLVKN